MPANTYIKNLIDNANNFLKEENEYTKDGELMKKYYSIKGLAERMYNINITNILKETTMTNEQKDELKELYKKSSEETYEEFDNIIKGNVFNFDNS